MRKPKFYYTFAQLQDDLHKNRKEYEGVFLEQGGVTSSCWFSNLPSNISKAVTGLHIPSIRKFIAELLRRKGRGDEMASEVLKGTLATAKTCPGVRGILGNTILLKAPCDISILVLKGGGWSSYTLPECSSLIKIEEGHPAQQLTPVSGTNPFKNKTVLKFGFPVHIYTKGTPWVYLQPQYHNSMEYQVVNGIIESPFTEYQELNLVTLVEDRGYDYSIDIKKGDVLAYIWTPTNLTLEYKEKKNGKSLLHTHFIGNFT